MFVYESCKLRTSTWKLQKEYVKGQLQRSANTNHKFRKLGKMLLSQRTYQNTGRETSGTGAHNKLRQLSGFIKWILR